MKRVNPPQICFGLCLGPRNKVVKQGRMLECGHSQWLGVNWQGLNTLDVAYGLGWFIFRPKVVLEFVCCFAYRLIIDNGSIPRPIAPFVAPISEYAKIEKFIYEYSLPYPLMNITCSDVKCLSCLSTCAIFVGIWTTLREQRRISIRINVISEIVCCDCSSILCFLSMSNRKVATP